MQIEVPGLICSGDQGAALTKTTQTQGKYSCMSQVAPPQNTKPVQQPRTVQVALVSEEPASLLPSLRKTLEVIVVRI